MKFILFCLVLILSSLPSTTPLLSLKPRSKLPSNPSVKRASELRHLIIDERVPMKSVKIEPCTLVRSPVEHMTTSSAVLEAIKNRVEKKSKVARKNVPKTKPTRRGVGDNNKIGLVIEGGGMRASTAAGMLAAISVLDLCDTFDVVYGSSAGAICGAYFVSRQMAVDVLTKVLVAAKELFVNKLAIYKLVATAALDAVVSEVQRRWVKYETVRGGFENERRVGAIGMNTTFVLANIMSPNGLRELDLDTFNVNNLVQPLRVVVTRADDSSVGSSVLDNFDDDSDIVVNDMPTALFRALQASMTVPGVAGAPSINSNATATKGLFCDAFCCEPIPYRSASKECTHMLVLQTRPRCANASLVSGLYDDLLAPTYFERFNNSMMARYHRNGGQLFTYAEDILLMNEAFEFPDKPIQIPTGDYTNDFFIDKQVAGSSQTYNSAFVYPIAVDGEELSPLEQDGEKVNSAFRDGFATCYDLLAPLQGISIDSKWNGVVAGSMLFGEKIVKEDEYSETITNPRFFPGFNIFNSTIFPHRNNVSKRAKIKRVINSAVLRVKLKRGKKEVGKRGGEETVDCFPGLRGDGRWDAFLPDMI